MLCGAILAAVSWLLITIGGLGFWFADRALREFAHMSFGLAELLGIGGSIVCMLVGFALRSISK
jgi:hypothetical protein